MLPDEIDAFINKAENLYAITVPASEVLSISTEGTLWGGEEKMLRYKKDHITITGFWNEEERMLYQITMTNAQITDSATSGPVSEEQRNLDLAVLTQNAESFLLKWDNKMTMKEIVFCSCGTVNEQRAVWMWAETEDDDGYYVILGEKSMEPIGIKKFPNGADPRNERG